MMTRAFTLIEILVVLAIVAIGSSILFAVVGGVRAKGMQAACTSNVAQIAKALILYSDLNDGELGWNVDPSWLHRIGDSGATPLRCPSLDGLPVSSSEHADMGGYAQNQCLSRRMSASDPALTVLTAEAARFIDPRSDGRYQPQYLSGPDVYSFSEESSLNEGHGYLPEGTFGALRHGGGAIYSFVDGHAKWLRPEQFRLPEHGYGCSNFVSSRWTWVGPVDGPYFSVEP